nr:winged helix DNA-binding domain-containing protein [Acidobacteriota bacterium]
SKLTDPSAVVESMLAMQGQDLPGVLYSIGLRLHGGVRSSVVAAFNSGQLVRSWPLRGTLHVMTGADLGSVLNLTAARLVRGAAARHRRLGINDDDVAACAVAARSALARTASAGRAGMTRRELYDVFASIGQATTGQRGIHILWLLALESVLVQGPLDGQNQLFVDYQQWLGPRERCDSDDVVALAPLALRYFTSHGPATERDFAWWISLPLTQVRGAIKLLGEALRPVEYSGDTYWLAAEAAVTKPSQRGLLALPGFDEYLLGYAQRSAALAPEHAQRTVPGNNGVFRPTVVAAGRVIGVWAKPATAAAPAHVEPFVEFTFAHQDSFATGMAKYQKFIAG